jgi:hypothetical protein
MTAVKEREVVGTLLNSWTETPVAWPNRDFEPPAAGEWITVTFRQGDAFQLEFGGSETAVTHRHPGVLFVQVFSRANKGDKRCLELADGVADIFRRARSGFSDGGMVFRTPAIRAIGVDGAYYQVNVTVPYIRDVLY